MVGIGNLGVCQVQKTEKGILGREYAYGKVWKCIITRRVLELSGCTMALLAPSGHGQTRKRDRGPQKPRGK